MNAVGEILELGQRLAWTVLRVLAGRIGLAVGAVAGRPHRNRPGIPDIRSGNGPDDEDEGFRHTATLMQQMQDQRDAWPEPPVTGTRRPMTYDDYRRGRR